MNDENTMAEENNAAQQETQSTSELIEPGENAADQSAGEQGAGGASASDSCPHSQPRDIPVNSLRRGRARDLRTNVAEIAHDLKKSVSKESSLYVRLSHIEKASCIREKRKIRSGFFY